MFGNNQSDYTLQNILICSSPGCPREMVQSNGMLTCVMCLGFFCEPCVRKDLQDWFDFTCQECLTKEMHPHDFKK